MDGKSRAARWRYPCPCCRYCTLPENSGNYICPVCFWDPTSATLACPPAVSIDRFASPAAVTDISRPCQPFRQITAPGFGRAGTALSMIWAPQWRLSPSRGPDHGKQTAVPAARPFPGGRAMPSAQSTTPARPRGSLVCSFSKRGTQACGSAICRDNQGHREPNSGGKPAARWRYPRPCCRHRTLPKNSANYICPVCFWEDDGRRDPAGTSPTKHELTLVQGRENYRARRTAPLLGARAVPERTARPVSVMATRARAIARDACRPAALTFIRDQQYFSRYGKILLPQIPVRIVLRGAQEAVRNDN
jgi:hypothetical protein